MSNQSAQAKTKLATPAAQRAAAKAMANAAPANATKAAPATTVAAPLATLPVAAPAQPWVAQPKYATTIAKATTLPATIPAGNVLLSVTGVVNRQGTARAAALAALQANIGQPQAVVLKAVAASEMAWHVANGRTPANLSPAGWLRTLGAKFGPAA